MKHFRRCQRILILSLLSISVLAPIVFVSHRLKNLSSIGRKDFIEDLSSIKFKRDNLRLKAIQQEAGEGLKEPRLVVYKDKNQNSAVSFSSLDDIHDSVSSENDGGTTIVLERTRNETNHESKVGDWQFQQRGISDISGEKLQEQFFQKVKDDQDVPSKLREVTDEKPKEIQDPKYNKAVKHDRNVHSQAHQVTDQRVNEMKDQLIRARAYLNFAPPGSNSHLVKELKLRIREVERAVGDATKDSDLSRSALQRMRHMETTLSKASQVYPDCAAMAAKLRAMTYTAEEQVRSQKKQASYLIHLAARTTPKGLHCLSMRLTAEYFSLEPKERLFPNQQNLNDPELYHYVVFSDNILACVVLVNSTVSSAVEPEKIVFHVVTDSLNFPAISMWFLLNPPGKATIQILSMDSFQWLFTKYNTTLKQTSSEPRYTIALNHLRFYLPDIFPALNKIVLFDHDVVVRKDLTGLWNVNMKGKVNGAVETCRKGESSYRRMNAFINFSDPFVAKNFDANACTWAFGLNLFDLREWRRHNLTALYQKYLKMGSERPLWMAGSLPLGWVTFYKQTVALDRRWHILGLGYDTDVVRGHIERAAVIHYNGIMKPWLDIAIGKYKSYWTRNVQYDHPYLQQCNIHE
ncbi:hypothetical protein UlMin_031537 [Ulmus minor]